MFNKEQYFYGLSHIDHLNVRFDRQLIHETNNMFIILLFLLQLLDLILKKNIFKITKLPFSINSSKKLKNK